MTLPRDTISYDMYPPKPAASPTIHPPGTNGKIEAMRARVDAGEQVFHSSDADTYEHVSEMVRKMVRPSQYESRSNVVRFRTAEIEQAAIDERQSRVYD